jgi:hypothetical protein
MSPEHAAILALTLFNQLATYEKTFGKIREPSWRHFADLSEQMPAIETPMMEPTGPA